MQETGTWKLLKLHLPEDIERNTDHTESIWKCKEMDINVLESWIFQYGGFFLIMSKCSTLAFWFLFFPELYENFSISLWWKYISVMVFSVVVCC